MEVDIIKKFMEDKEWFIGDFWDDRRCVLDSIEECCIICLIEIWEDYREGYIGKNL